MTPFLDAAPALWAAGISAIPLIAGQKRPAIVSWQVYQERMPTEEEMVGWLRRYPDGNVGCALGPSSDLCCVDVDSMDPAVKAAIEAVLPETPWVRVGKKGAVYGYRHLEGVKPFKIKAATGEMLVEFLSAGNQVVVPPSVHPETRKAYEATASLAAVKASLPHLPADVEERIRGALLAAKVKVSLVGYSKVADWVPLGARDNAVVGRAGGLARAVLRRERTLLEAIAEMTEWHRAYVEEAPGDAIPVEKGISRLVAFLNRDVLDRKRTLPSGWDVGLTAEDKKRLGVQVGDDDVEWNHDRIKAFMMDVFTRTTPDGQDRLDALKEVMARVARSQHLDTMDRERLFNWLASTCKELSVTKGSLRVQLVELQKGEVEGTSHKEIAEAALQELAEKGGEVRHHEGSFWRWCGTHFERLEDVKLLKEVIDLYGELPMGRRGSDHRQVLETMRTIATGPLRSVEVKGINFANGFLTPRLELLPHDPAFGATYRLPFRYDPAQEDRCHKWLEMLRKCWGHNPDYEDKVKALRQMIAVTMFGMAPSLQRAFVLYGLGGSGKSVVQDVVLNLMPEGCVSSVPPHDWDDKFLPAQLSGKLLNQCGELSDTRLIGGEMFKSIVTGEPVMAQHKNQTPFVMRAVCANWFASNHLPLSRDGSNGFTRRWLILEFDRVVPPQERIPNYGIKVAAEEREAIAAWAVGAILGMDGVGADYVQPASHRMLLGEVAFRNNPLLEFMQRGEELAFGPRQECTFDELMQCYRNWCLQRLQRPQSPPAVLHKLREFRSMEGREFEISHEERLGRTVAVYRGVGLRKGGKGRKEGWAA